eukprot:snap_masked-scaffold92_size382268-processed-gene-2.19 protein:Tk08764 transcript:snap_masked-scaffold92_size382268-processed-gene-2.19-mRNA-1 annotation:"GH12415"
MLVWMQISSHSPSSGLLSLAIVKSLRGFIGVICQPGTFTGLELGYVVTPDGRCEPVQEVDLPLWAHGEGGKDPKDFAFRFKADHIWHDIQVKVLDTVEVFFGWEWEGRILERFCEYTIDGVPGWGVSEWHYRHRGGRPAEMEAKDPAHTKGGKDMSIRWIQSSGANFIPSSSNHPPCPAGLGPGLSSAAQTWAGDTASARTSSMVHWNPEEIEIVLRDWRQ